MPTGASSELQTLPRAENNSMSDVERLWTTIPVSEDKAESATEIWRRYDLWARSSLHHKLNRLAAEGRIKRISRAMPQGGEVHLYYRSAE